MEPDEKMIRLMAVAASVACNCQSCLLASQSSARAAGASEPEIAAAVETGQKVRAGAAAKMDTYISSIQEIFGKTAGSVMAGCGCSELTNP